MSDVEDARSEQFFLMTSGEVIVDQITFPKQPVDNNGIANLLTLSYHNSLSDDAGLQPVITGTESRRDLGIADWRICA
jgi:hypothetical protein